MEFLEVLSYVAVFFLGVWVRGRVGKPLPKNVKYADRDGNVMKHM